MPGIMDLLGGLGEGQGGPDNPMSPEMIALLTELGKGKVAPAANQKILQQSGTNPYHATHWSQGVADMLNAVSGQNMINRADQSRTGSRLRVPTVAGPTQPNAPPNSGRVPPQMPIDPNPAQTMFGVRPGPIPQGFSEAPNDQGATTNNDPARMSLGVAPPAPARENSDTLPPEYASAIQRFEGFTPRAQWDYRQHSNGFGTRARSPGEVIDRPEAERRFNEEIGRAREIVRNVGVQMTPGQEAALTSLTFNAGANWVNSGLGNAVRNGDWARAQELFTQYNRAGGEVLPGLTRRRQEEATWLTGGDNNAALPVVQAADRSAPQDNPPPARDMSNRPLGRAGLPIFNPEVDFRPTFPTPPPDDFGLTPQQSMDLDNLSERAYKRKVESLSRQWEPQYTDTAGGRRWIVPATGQTGFIPTPKYDHVEANGAKVPVVTIYDAYGRSYTYEQAPSGEISQLPGAQTTAPNAAPAPVTPQAAPNAVVEPEIAPNAAPAPVAPPVTPNAPTLDNIPPLPNAPPAPPAARKSWLDGPTFTRAREIARTEEEKKTSLVARAGAREEPIKQAIEVGNEASRTQAVVDQLRELENLPGLARLPTGPGAETILNARTGINMALQAAGLPQWDAEMVAAGEALRKLNTILGSVGARQLTNRPTQFDFQAFLKANPGMLVSSQGRRFLTEILGQMSARDVELGNAASAYRGRAEDWPKVRDEIMLRHRPVINGNVLDATVSNSRFNATTGQLEFSRPVRGMIVGNPQGESFQYIGRTGNAQDGRNETLWIKVDPRKPETWRFPEMETPTRK